MPSAIRLSSISIIKFCVHSVSYIAGEFGNHLKRQFEAEIKYQYKKDHPDPDPARAVSEEEVLCLQVAGLCHDLGKYYRHGGLAQLVFSIM